jgi:hypothetical protein
VLVALADRSDAVLEWLAADSQVARLRHLTALVELVTVSGATHLFAEPRALEEVARLAVARR